MDGVEGTPGGEELGGSDAPRERSGGDRVGGEGVTLSYASNQLQVLRGRVGPVAVGCGLAIFVGIPLIAAMMAPWSTGGPASWVQIVVLGLFGIAASMTVIFWTALTSLHVRRGFLLYKFGPIVRRRIPLDSVSHFELWEFGRAPCVWVFCNDGRTFSPGEVIDHKKVVALLEANGVAREEAEMPEF